MAKSIQEILGAAVMTGVVQTAVTGLPSVLPPAFTNVTDRVVGNRATFLKVGGTQRHAQTSEYGSPARHVQREPLSEAGLTMLHSFESQNHNPLVLQNLLGLNGEVPQAVAISEIDRQTVNFASRFASLRLVAAYSVLRYGAIYIDSSGNVLLDSTGAAVTVDYGVPAGNKDQISGIIGTTWATDSTDIVADITAIKNKARKATGRPLKYAFYGSNILTYLLTNLKVKELINNTPMLAERLYNSGEIPDGFMGLTWVPMHTAYALNSSGTATDLWGGDTVVFCPEVNSGWWRFFEGSYLVPNDVGQIYADVIAAARNLSLVYGRFAYGTIDHNPAGVTQYAGDTFFPLLASPNDLYIADVVP